MREVTDPLRCQISPHGTSRTPIGKPSIGPVRVTFTHICLGCTKTSDSVPRANRNQQIPMRILGLDHGTKRVGVAVSDELKIIATPLEHLAPDPFADFLARFLEILRAQKVELILIGMPRNMDGSYGPAALKVQDFVARLKAEVNVPIKTWDERLTSKQANRCLIQGGVRREHRKEKVDKTAAAILLQSYLDSLAP